MDPSMVNFFCVKFSLDIFILVAKNGTYVDNTHRGLKYPQVSRPIVIPPQKPEVTYPTVLGFAFCGIFQR